MQGIGQLVYESNVLVMNLCDKEKLKKELLLSSKLYQFEISYYFGIRGRGVGRAARVGLGPHARPRGARLARAGARPRRRAGRRPQQRCMLFPPPLTGKIHRERRE